MIMHVVAKWLFMWGNTVRGKIARGNTDGEDLRSLFVIIKKGENVICSFDDLTNLGTS